MAYKFQRGSDATRQLLGTLLVAWTLVTGCAAVFASALYYRTGDVKIIIAWLGAPFVIGSALLLVVVIAGISTHVKDGEYGEPPDGLRRRQNIHGRR